jgi:hypothetical protein
MHVLRQSVETAANSDLCKVSPIPRQRPFVWRAAKVGREPTLLIFCIAANVGFAK